MICIAKETYQNRTVEEYITDLSKRKLERFNVSLTVANLECNEDLPFQFYDVFTIIFCVSYLMMVYQSTKYDVRRDDPKTPVSKYDKWFKIFSMRHNWRAIVRTNTNSDYVNLKSLDYKIFVIGYKVSTKFHKEV
ncbi:uncharacterized protein LOC143200732 [Rhynchophorus ferrugineus]|uniref:uncharacterized protein LOC143200732 n=1 Tax=Rhynchophorus ferrugineus TaxID=354439 RepID=UPI003FCD0807